MSTESVLSTEPIVEKTAEQPAEQPAEQAASGNGDTATATVKPRRKRNKPTKPTYAVPDGKLRSSETPGFNVQSHAKLKPTDFHDPLDHAKWEVWFYTEKQRLAQQEVETLLALGNTPEERSKAKEDARILKMLENAIMGHVSSGNADAASRLADRLGSLFQKVSAAGTTQ